MKDIKELNLATSPYELLDHLCDGILSGKLRSFDSLRTYLSGMPDGPASAYVFRKAFDLQKRLYWGFFKDLNPEGFQHLWQEVVVPDRRYRFAGDLKRSMSIPTVFIGLIDIHGYTKFCHKNRRNMSMLSVLDGMLQQDVPRLAAKLGVLSRRARGDEVLLLGASAADVLETVLQIIDYLAKGKRFKEDPGTQVNRAGGEGPIPVFKISAGIAGGQKYSSLIITEDGDLSGDIVNMAARLQHMAGRISPDNNKVLLTSHVYQKLKATEDKNGRGPSSRDFYREVGFFNTGIVEFKGISLDVYDTVFMATESHRLSYLPMIKELYDSIEKGLWKGKIFEDALNLAGRIVSSIPTPSFSSAAWRGDSDLGVPSLMEAIRKARQCHDANRFEQAVSCLDVVTEGLSRIVGMDELALEYMKEIVGNYQLIVASFQRRLDAEIDEHIDTIFGAKELENFKILQKHHATYSKVREAARLNAQHRRNIWQRVADEEAKDLLIRIQSRK